MKNFFYLRGLRRSTIQFLDLFNDIQIAKYNSNNQIEKFVDVPLKYVPKQKFYTWAYDRKYEKRFPMMGVELTDIEYDESRVSGKYGKIKVSSSNGSSSFYQMGIPYNISYSLNVTTNYMVEMDQITEQILPYFSPNVMTTVGMSGTDFTWDMNVVFNGATIDQDANIEMDSLRKIHWTFSFMSKTYLFKPISSVKNIEKVVLKYYLSDDSFNRIDTTTDMPSGAGAEDFEGMVLGWMQDDEIMTRYEKFE